jgi:hypothetical protein
MDVIRGESVGWEPSGQYLKTMLVADLGSKATRPSSVNSGVWMTSRPEETQLELTHHVIATRKLMCQLFDINSWRASLATAIFPICVLSASRDLIDSHKAALADNVGCRARSDFGSPGSAVQDVSEPSYG